MKESWRRMRKRSLNPVEGVMERQRHFKRPRRPNLAARVFENEFECYPNTSAPYTPNERRRRAMRYAEIRFM